MKSIEISNFKNFKNLKVDNLGAINLIVGKNNAGKSTLLEAISLSASGGSIGWLKKILEIRGLNSQISTLSDAIEEIGLETLCSLSHGYNLENFMQNPIRIKATENQEERQTVEISIVRLIRSVEYGENGIELTRLLPVDKFGNDVAMIDEEPILGISISINANRTYYSVGQFFKRRNFLSFRNIPFEYVRTAEFTGDTNPALFDKVALTPMEGVLIKSLQIIDPHINAINYLNEDRNLRSSYSRPIDNRVPFVGYDNMPGKYRLSAMGDGINRILTIMLSMINCKDGILLVDEFENGLHYSVQTDLWKLIFCLASQLNIQVFATTHSQDCIKSFLKASRELEELPEYGAARLIRLERRKDDEIAVVYDDPDELDYISENDIETR
ncbi:MAG: AAA family ATPase [Muribaculaceae bacterium]|nr:AAA family ATPase [Muribaculaceae bacterium]